MTDIITQFKSYLKSCLSKGDYVDVINGDYINSDSNDISNPLISVAHTYFCKQDYFDYRVVINTWLAMRELMLKNFKSIPSFKDIIKTLQAYREDFCRYCTNCGWWYSNDRMWVYHFFKDNCTHDDYIYAIITVAKKLQQIYHDGNYNLTFPAVISGNLQNDNIVELKDKPLNEVINDIIIFLQETMLQGACTRTCQDSYYYNMFDYIVYKLRNTDYTNHMDVVSKEYDDGIFNTHEVGCSKFTDEYEYAGKNDSLYLIQCVYAAVRLILEKKFDIGMQHDNCETFLNNHKTLKYFCCKYVQSCGSYEQPFICIHCFAYDVVQDCIKYGGCEYDEGSFNNITANLPEYIQKYNGVHPSAEEYEYIIGLLLKLQRDIHNDSHELYKKFTVEQFKVLKYIINDLYINLYNYK